MNDRYMYKAHCHVLAECVLSLAESMCIPENIHKKALELAEMCDDYVGDGYSMSVSYSADNDIERSYSSPSGL